MASHWLNWCRLCAKDDPKNSFNIFHIDDGGREQDNLLVAKILKHFKVDICRNDNLSTIICLQCYKQITELTKFIEHVFGVQAIFAQLRNIKNDPQIDMEELRKQYGLEIGCKKEELKCDDETLPTAMATVPDLIELTYDSDNALVCSQEKVTVDCVDIVKVEPPPPPNPIKRGRGRPRTKSLPIKAIIPSHNQSVTTIDNSSINLSVTLEQLSKASTSPSLSSSSSSSLPLEDKSGPKYTLTRCKMQCPQCEKSFKNPASFKKHKAFHNINDADDSTMSCEVIKSVALTKRYICQLCGRELKTLKSLNRHKLLHTKDRQYQCSCCDSRFKTLSHLQKHSEIHKGRVYECPICGKSLRTLRLWKLHKVTHEEDTEESDDDANADDDYNDGEEMEEEGEGEEEDYDNIQQHEEGEEEDYDTIQQQDKEIKHNDEEGEEEDYDTMQHDKEIKHNPTESSISAQSGFEFKPKYEEMDDDDSFQWIDLE